VPFGEFGVYLDRHGEPRQIGTAQGENILPGTFLSVDGGQDQEAAQGDMPLFARVFG